VIAWNLTRRCNLECAHCYIAAGPHESATGELSTAECLRIAREILAVNPSPMFILSGGEPLLRDDLADIARFASSRGATVVIGTNGTLLTSERMLLHPISARSRQTLADLLRALLAPLDAE